MAVVKDPQAILEYGVDWKTNWLKGDTIVASTWELPAGIELGPTQPSVSDGVATVWLAGGALGETYKVVNHITTAQGRQDDRTLHVVIQHR